MRKIHITLQDNTIPVLLIALSLTLLTLIVVSLLMMRPVADDYAYFSDSLINNPIKFTAHYYLDWTGRSMQALWMSSLYRIFGNSVVIYGGLVQLGLLILSAIFFAYTLLKNRVSNQLWTISTGLICALFAVYMSPSLFDTNLWITSSSVYIGSMIALFISLGLTILVLTTAHMKKWHIPGLVLIIFLAQLFSEPTSIIMVYLGVIAVIASYAVRGGYSNFRTVSWSWLLASIAGFLFMYLSPGTHARQSELHVSTSPYSLLAGAIGDLDKLMYIFTSYRIWLILLVGIALAALFYRINERQRLWIIAISSLSAFAIPLSLFIATRYTMGEYAPLRAFSVPAALFGLSLSVLIAAASGWIMSPVKSQANKWINLIFGVSAMAICLSTIQASIPTLQAVAMRTQLYDNREESIKQQIDLGSKTIYIEPLPVLLDNTDAVDLYYNAHTPSWLAGAFKQYYKIPNDTIIVHDTQPEGYCLQYRNPVWFGTKTCKELDQ